MIILNKPVGQTPLQALDQLRAERPELKNEILSYAGRLDPMAEGLLLVLVGDENKDRQNHLGLDKEYEVEILLGVETDSYDILGLIVADGAYTLPAPNQEGKVATKVDAPSLTHSIRSELNKFVGNIDLPYPPYSSKPVNGKPLFEWAKRGGLDKIKIPSQHFNIHSLDLLDISETPEDKLKKYIYDSISKISGDFRQDKIVESWDKYFEKNKTKSFTVLKIKVSCESGTYMRSLAHELGRKLGTSAIALSIRRTRIGDYKI